MSLKGRSGFAITTLVAAALTYPIEGALAGPLDSAPLTPGSAPTSTSLKSGSSKAVYGKKVNMYAKLTSLGKQLKKRNVSLYQNLPGVGWQKIARSSTDSSGRAVFKVKPDSEKSYAAAYEPDEKDTGRYSQSESNEVKLSVSPSIGLGLGRAAHSALPGQRVRVTGSIKPGDLDTKVTVRVTRNGRKKLVSKVTLKNGHFKLSFKASLTGKYRVKASSTEETGFAAGESRQRTFRTVYPNLGPGSSGAAVRHLQYRLKKLHYWVKVNGNYDGATSRGVLAFRKVTGMARTARVNPTVWKKISRGAGRFNLRHKWKGRYVEADLSRQVLVLARNGKVHRILHTSTGAPATPTILGNFRFYQHQPGYNAKRMFYSIYFIRGYAIHGFDPVPTYPASHGCLRIPIQNAKAVYRWIKKGDRISVYP